MKFSIMLLFKQLLLVIGMLLVVCSGIGRETSPLLAAALLFHEPHFSSRRNLLLTPLSRCNGDVFDNCARFSERKLLPLCARGKASGGEAEQLREYYGNGDEFNGEFLDSNDSGESLLDEDQMLDYSISAFLSGEYDRDFAEDAPAPNPLLTPQNVISSVLQSLRHLDDPEPSHGAAVLMRFCVPLSRGERWGDSASTSSSKNNNSDSKTRDVSNTKLRWKDILRGAITATMLARRLRSSELSVLLDWTSIDVTEGAYSVQRDDGMEIGVPSSSALAFVNAALYFEDGVEPTLVQFTLRKINNVWLIDSAHISQKKLFADPES